MAGSVKCEGCKRATGLSRELVGDGKAWHADCLLPEVPEEKAYPRGAIKIKRPIEPPPRRRRRTTPRGNGGKRSKAPSRKPAALA